MPRSNDLPRWHTVLLLISTMSCAPLASMHADEGQAAKNAPAQPKSAAAPGDAERAEEPSLFSGKVLPLREALKRQGIASFSEFDGQVALVTPRGEVIPLVPDWRGRAFFQDERLRNRKVDLLGFRREGQPYLQVISIYTFDEQGQRQYTDYWCDICSIPMYEIKPCDCCQQEIRLRFQPRELPKHVRPADQVDAKRPSRSRSDANSSPDSAPAVKTAPSETAP